MRVLVAEDNEVNQIVVSAALGSAGHVCDIVSNGRQAVTAVEQKAYDLVLMDCQMPEMDGLEATRRIRQRETARGSHRVPIIALTANAIQGDREICLAAGMDDYLTKPIDFGELTAAIARCVHSKSDVKKAQADSIDLPQLHQRYAATPQIIPTILDRFEKEIRSLRTILESDPSDETIRSLVAPCTRSRVRPAASRPNRYFASPRV